MTLSTLTSAWLGTPVTPALVLPSSTCRAPFRLLAAQVSGEQTVKRQPADAQRLSKVLASAGVASRRAAEDLIFAGRVSVNDKLEALPQTHVSPGRDKITIDGKAIRAQRAAKVYFALHKPKGYICSNAPSANAQHTPRLAVDLLSDWVQQQHSSNTQANALPTRLFTVGRLDVQSTGLILVTNDGHWANTISHPATGITKEYVVTVNARPNKQQLRSILEGCVIDGTHVMPVGVQLEDSDPQRRNKVRVVLAEGKNREVRELMSHAGLDVIYLKRVRVGGYRLPKDLAIGQFRELKPHEVRRVTDKAAQSDPYL